MKASITLGKPENWQDFESLCKKLWGEIWKCPEIKKNGRAGQNQNGVDVYGIPINENQYYGIQCKGKGEYTHKQLAIGEVRKEIEKAKTFEPKLKKLYFATTAVKDAKFERDIRIINLEHKNLNLFEVHLFSWEDIVDLIEENQETYNYYINSNNFKTSNSVSITFSNDKNETTSRPIFLKRTTSYLQKIAQPQILTHSFLNELKVNELNKIEVNESFCKIQIKIKNTGSTPLEEYKVFLEFEGENLKEISKTNEKGIIFNFHNKYSNIKLNPETLTGEITPKHKILVGDDLVLSDSIFLKTSHEKTDVNISWRLISKSYKQFGNLKLHVEPKIELKYNEILVEDPKEVGIVESQIEDYIIEKK